MSELASIEALRIVRSIEVEFPSGPGKSGSGFIVVPGKILTCAHVVINDKGQTATKVTVINREGIKIKGSVIKVKRDCDVAILDAPAENDSAPDISKEQPRIGRFVIVSGKPQGINKPSIFPAMISDIDTRLASMPNCLLVQISGMINNGNSGGPVLDGENGKILGMVTAKYVPMLNEIDKLINYLEKIPQLPSDVGLGQIDFAGFVNLTIESMWQLGAVLRLVQVGVGWAIPTKYFADIKGD